MEWHRLQPGDFAANPAASTDRACDYFNTLMATEPGRRVLFDILHILGYFDVAGGDEPAVRLARLQTAKQILTRCGVTDEMAIVRALAGTAKLAGEPEKVEEQPNMYDEQEIY